VAALVCAERNHRGSRLYEGMLLRCYVIWMRRFCMQHQVTMGKGGRGRGRSSGQRLCAQNAITVAVAYMKVCCFVAMSYGCTASVDSTKSL
jgi:hypothetical protein